MKVIIALSLGLACTGCMSYYVTINSKQDAAQQSSAGQTGIESPLACDRPSFNQANSVQVSGGGNEKPIRVETAREASASIPLK